MKARVCLKYFVNDCRQLGIGDVMVFVIFLTLGMSECGKSPNLGKNLLRSSIGVTSYSEFQLW